jgi:hypothetical protein
MDKQQTLMQSSWRVWVPRAPVCLVVALAALLLTATALGQAARPSSARSLDDVLLALVAREHGIPVDRLRIVDRITLTYPLTKVQLVEAKVLDTATGTAYEVAVDQQGHRRDPDKAAKAEEAAEAARFGKLDPRLSAKLEAVGPNAKISVSIWLNVPPFEAARGSGSLSQYQEALRVYMTSKRQGVVQALVKMGVTPRVSVYSPTVFADLTRGQIREIAKRPDVAKIYGPDEYTVTRRPG